MQGRYGFDHFSQVIIIVALLISVVGTLFHSSLFTSLSYIPLAYAVYRTLSKDVNKRSQENYKFGFHVSNLKNRIEKRVRLIRGSQTHRFYQCPKCGQTIRVPKGKGKIMITCPKCKHTFVKRT